MRIFNKFFSRKLRKAAESSDAILLLRKSYLLDPVWYRQAYSDLRHTPIDVASHYLQYGAKEGRDPHPLFNTNFYLEQYPDVANSNINPLVHYILHGAQERRDPHPLFDIVRYTSDRNYVEQPNLDPLTHYLTIGWKQGLRPHRRFDPKWYLDQNSDLSDLKMEPLSHYLTYGWKENRSPNSWFDTDGYRARYRLSQDINPLVDYALRERSNDASPETTSFNKKSSVEPCLARSPLYTFETDLIRDSRAFDERFYVETYPEVAASGIDPLVHFNALGWRAGFNPCAIFDTKWYLEQNPDVRAANINPLEHYLRCSSVEPREPFPCFDSRWYLEQYSDVIPTGISPLVHYLREGAALGLDPCPYFHTLWYVNQYPDVLLSGVNPLWHYVTYGALEGRDPSPFFDTDWYLSKYSDVRAIGVNALEHFLRHGKKEGRSPQPKCSELYGYEKWIDAHESFDSASLKVLAESVPTMRWHPIFSIVVPTYNTPDLALRAFLDSVLAQVYPYWELCIADDHSSQESVRLTVKEYADKDARIKVTFREKNGHISLATNSAMALAEGGFICLMDHDDEIAPNALYEFALKLNEDSDLDLIYSDEDKVSVEGQRYEPFFKPDWSPETLEACMYIGHLACYRASLVQKIGGFREEFNGAQDYDFALRFTEIARHIAHVPKILYHWRALPGSTAVSMDNKDYVIDAAVRALEERVHRTGELGWVKPNRYKGCFDVRRAINGHPKVSIIIPSAGRDSEVYGVTIDLLAHCIERIVAISSYKNFDFVVIHNGDLRDSTLRRLKKYEHLLTMVHFDEPIFNVAKKINLGAKKATGDYFLLLNDDIEVISPDWIEAMLSIAQNPEVGAVGSRLYFEDGTLQHVGVAFWEGLPDHIRRGFPHDDPGHFFSSVGQRNYLAVTGACIMSHRKVFEQVTGFDEMFGINYNDVDYCLKIHRNGLRIVYAAQAELKHFESRNRSRTVAETEINLFLDRWANYVQYDPYYSPYFDAHPPNFKLKD